MKNGNPTTAGDTRPTQRARGDLLVSENHRELLDIRDVSRICGCSLRTVHRLVASGQMPSPIKLGSLTRWSRAELSAWISSRCPSVRPLARKGRNV